MALSAVVANSNSSGVTGAGGLVHGPQSPLVDTKRTCARIAASDATVLLMGETGTGKEVFARFIHNGSPRATRPFVPVNCGAIPETLLESELFGYVKGAFTGAVGARRGRVGLAEGGTLFLDEIGELPLSLQVKLLRLLQERSYEPIGSSDSIPANFRLVAATNRDLTEEVRLGRFRSDLYYRLHVCPIRLPALRERRCDIMHLFHSFWSRRGELRSLDAGVVQCLEAYAWPGNVRELENLVERVSVCAEGESIRVSDLPLAVRSPQLGNMDSEDSVGALPLREEFGDTSPGSSTGPLALASVSRDEMPLSLLTPEPTVSIPISLPSLGEMANQLRERALSLTESPAAEMRTVPPEHDAGNTPTPILQFPIDLPTMLRELENRYINAALVQTGSNKKEAAKLLGMGRTTLVEKLRRRSTDQRPSTGSEPSDE